MPCTRAEAEALKDDISPLALLDVPPVLMTSEAEGDAWRLDAYFAEAADSGDDRPATRAHPKRGRDRARRAEGRGRATG